MDQPTIFLSSTIYDFRDLRSAVKDYLEQKGCRVLASEFNDFTKPLDRHSYEACLETIKQADHFLLLIGTRVGGWYDEATRISITQQEYRTAYDLAQRGQMRLLSFVRADVWNHRQNTKELVRHLKSISELDDEMRHTITHYPTTFATDGQFIISFIDEVSRNRETAAAVKEKAALPIGNWIHTFSDFADIRQVLDPLILRGLSVKDAAGRKALQSQLLTLLQDMLPMIKNRPIMPNVAIRKLANEIGLSRTNLTGSMRVKSANWDTFVYLSLMAPRGDPDEVPFISTLNTDVLLHYDPQKSSFHHTPTYDALAELVNQIRKFRRAKQGYNLGETLMYGKSGRQRDGSVAIPVPLIATLLQVLFRWADVVSLAKSIVPALDGLPLNLAEAMPRTPIQDEEAAVVSEELSLEQVRTFVGLDRHRT